MDIHSSEENQHGNAEKPVQLIVLLCLAQVLSMLGVFAFPALLPHFLKIWNLSNSQAGWINGIYFIGYSLAVPILSSLTDRMDPRRIYLAFCVIGGLANLGFAVLVDGFWLALLFRGLAGLGLAGTFIPGLKGLIDRLEEAHHSRAVSFYTASFGLGMSLSFYCTGKVFDWMGWQAAFGAAAGGSALALVLSYLFLKPRPVKTQQGRATLRQLLDFRPVWANKEVRAYILAYMCHTWEMFAARAWMVAFLTFSLAFRGMEKAPVAPTTVLAIAGIVGMFASIAGGELADRFERRRVVRTIMAVSFLVSLSMGFALHLPYYVVACLCVVYTVFFQGDSAAIHSGVINAAEEVRRGTTMALQSLGGFMAASLGSVATGFVLDFSGGGQSPWSWGLTFGAMGATAFLGNILLRRASPDQNS